MKRFTLILIAFLFMCGTAFAVDPVNLRTTNSKQGGIMIGVNAGPGSAYVLTATTGVTVTWPSGTTHIILSCTPGKSVWLLPGGSSSLTVPASTSEDGAQPMLNPLNYLLDVQGYSAAGMVTGDTGVSCSMTSYRYLY